MVTVMAFMAALADETQKRDDAVRTLVLMFRASYLGIAVGTALLFEGVKMLATKAVTGRENLMVVVLTLVLGGLAKWLMPSLYGETDRKAWALHMVSLVFVAIIGMMFHDTERRSRSPLSSKWTRSSGIPRAVAISAAAASMRR